MDFFPWAQELTELFSLLNTDPNEGLDSKSIITLRKKYDSNTLTLNKPVSLLSIFIQQIKSVIVLLLAISTIISFFLSQWIEGIAIIAVLIINTFIGFVTELKAIRSMESLREMGKVSSTVIRSGNHQVIDADELVPGDIVLFEAGDIVSADIRIIEASRLMVDESALTGESIPVEKDINLVSKKAIISNKTNMLFRGTFLTNGSAKGLVVHTGMNTEMGKIAKITQQAHQELTPLEKRLDALGKKLIWVSLSIAVLVAISGVLGGKSLILMLETAVALAIATIPEGLPIVATLALAKGMWLLSKKNVLVNKLSAVETLGATSIIFTDKTGTLTENKMSVRTICNLNDQFDFSDNKLPDKFVEECLEIATLCNNANEIDDRNYTGDPMEVALLKAARKHGILRSELIIKAPELKEEAFSPETRMMATIHQFQDKTLYAIKGAPEAVIDKAKFYEIEGILKEITPEIRNKLLALNFQMAQDGLRVLAVATKTQQDENAPPYLNLTFKGLIGMLDSARPDIKSSIENCTKAGIKVVMATGDQAATAQKIAKDIHLDESKLYSVITGDELDDFGNLNSELKNKIDSTIIFSRVSPAQKLELVNYYQRKGYVVAMTGDGVNDAPALKKADLGVAMGLRGTQVAKDASDMVLGDDKFSSIVTAIKLGRIIYSNIQKFVIYLLSCNIAEVFIISFATLINAPLPLLPLQILFLNLVTDVFPALALGMGEGDESYLNRPPRDKEDSVISIRKWKIILFYGTLMTVAVLAAYFHVLESDHSNENTAVTVAFLTLGISQVFHIFNMRLTNSKIVSNDITKNPHVWGAIVFCISLMVYQSKLNFSEKF